MKMGGRLVAGQPTAPRLLLRVTLDTGQPAMNSVSQPFSQGGSDTSPSFASGK